MNEIINSHFQNQHFDFRNAPDARFIDQKCIPDVVSAVAQIIIENTANNPNCEFTTNDVWHNDVAVRLFTEELFSKPSPEAANMEREYDKVFGQPLRMFAYAKILNCRRNGNNGPYFYSINNRDLLEFISVRERNALEFLFEYITKFLIDSNWNTPFDRFFRNQDAQSLIDLHNFLDTVYNNIWQIGKKESRRIYNKWINILAFRSQRRGVSNGRISQNRITIDSIRYTAINWRDLNKPQDVSREEWARMLQARIEENADNSTVYANAISRAKRQVRELHPFSEIHRFQNYPTSQAHHIFMASEFPELADSIENIIALTPNQHFIYAHPNNRTQQIDLEYQIVCLISKLDSIEIDYMNNGNNYSFDEFKNVLNIGFNTSEYTPQMTFEEVKFKLMKTYQQLRFA